MIIINYTWRITKYNPIYRDETGSYAKEDWVFMSEIGDEFDGERLTKHEYLHVEDKYVNAVIYFMNYLKIDSLKVSKLEKRSQDIYIVSNPELYTTKMHDLYKTIDNNQSISTDEVVDLCKLILRNNIWCILSFEEIINVYFGHDYYMFIGCAIKCDEVLTKIIESGLFVEPWISQIAMEEDEEDYDQEILT